MEGDHDKNYRKLGRLTNRQHLLARLFGKAEVKKFGFHRIRHLAATELYRRGCSVAVIQRILRHTSPNTTVRYLQSLGVDGIRSAMEEFAGSCRVPFSSAAFGTENKKPSLEPSRPYEHKKSHSEMNLSG